MTSCASTTTRDHQFYRALTARDARFDGVFFVGVRTTGIYCRPICPARTPLESHCSFFVSAAAAERRGFRPCLRCRPELASGHAHASVAAVDIVRARALDAGARIASGALDHGVIETLATELGISSRHLRRVVEREFGASPIALAQTRRLLTAKQLLTETTLPVSTIAMASGFGSVRRFNALFSARYRLSPGALRPAAIRANSAADHAGVAVTGPHARMVAAPRVPDPIERSDIQLTVTARAPFHWSDMCAYLKPRAIPGVEVITLGDAPRYSRIVQHGEHTGVVSIAERLSAPRSRTSESGVALNVSLSLSLLPVLVPILARVRRMLDLDASPHVIAEHLGQVPLLRNSIAARPGMRVPGTMDGFELAVRAILGQQVSVRGATTLAGRLVDLLSERCSSAVGGATTHHALQREVSSSHHTSLTHKPLSPDSLANASLAQLRAIGLPSARAQCLLSLARAVVDGDLPELTDAVPTRSTLAQFEARMTALPGIGPWTAQYVAMRALRYSDAFPSGDLALRKAAGGVSDAALRKRAEFWRPWRAYAAMHLWASLS